MFALLCTMSHSIIRQMAINTQNIIVLALEFTNYSFFRGEGEAVPATSVIRPGKATFFRRLNAR
jgi:hypothetical protein